MHLYHVWTEPTTVMGHACLEASTSRAKIAPSGISQLLASHISTYTKPKQHNLPTAFENWLTLEQWQASMDLAGKEIPG